MEVAIATATSNTGNVLSVVEGRGHGLKLWAQNMPLSGREDPKRCGVHTEAYVDPSQFIVSTESRFNHRALLRSSSERSYSPGSKCWDLASAAAWLFAERQRSTNAPERRPAGSRCAPCALRLQQQGDPLIHPNGLPERCLGRDRANGGLVGPVPVSARPHQPFSWRARASRATART